MPPPAWPSRTVGHVVRDMDEFELEAIRVGEEHRVVGWLVIVLGGRVEDLNAALEEQLVEAVDLLTALGVPGEVVQARRVPVVLPSPPAFGRRAEDHPLPVTCGGGHLPGQALLALLSELVAYEAQERVVEGLRTRHVAHGEAHVVRAAGLLHRGAPSSASSSL